jgi:4-amino-4-deoxy-L-arabinose transferase-like glycosyltransferase
MGPGTFSEHSAPLQEIRAGERVFWSLAAIAFLVRLAVLWTNLSHAQPFTTVPDSGSYLRWGQSLADHGAMVGPDGQPALSRPPGYPALLALTFLTGLATPDRLAGALVLQVLVSSIVVALAARIASVFGGRSTGLLAGAILAIEPSSISYSNLILTETLYACVLVAAVLAFWRWLTGSGLLALTWFAALLSFLPLIRPVALHLPWVLCPIVFWSAPRSLRLKSAVLFLTIALLPSAAWSARNWRHFGIAVFDQTMPLAKATFARQVEDRAGPPGAQSGSDSYAGSDNIWSRHYADSGSLPIPEAMHRQEDYFRATLTAHPVAAVEEWAYTGVTIIGSPDSWLQAQLTGHLVKTDEGSVLSRLRWLVRTGPLLPVILLGMIISLGGLALLPVFVWQSRTWPSPRRSFALLMATLVVYHLVLASFVRWQAERYRVPIMPCLAIVLLVGAFGLATAAGRRRPSAGARPST